MLSEIEKTMDIIRNSDVKLIALFRIDGVPIIVKTIERTQRILNSIYWLQRQIKDFLNQIFIGDLDDLKFKSRDLIIGIYPISKTLALIVITSDEISLYKLESDIESICLKIRDMV